MSIFEIFVKELLNSVIFSLPEIFNITRPNIIIKARGMAVIIPVSYTHLRAHET